MCRKQGCSHHTCSWSLQWWHPGKAAISMQLVKRISHWLHFDWGDNENCRGWQILWWVNTLTAINSFQMKLMYIIFTTQCPCMVIYLFECAKYFTGKLQIYFTAGLLKRPIRMFCEGSCLGFVDTLLPCSCHEGPLGTPIAIMWVHANVKGKGKKVTRSTTPNHIVPLVPNPSGTVHNAYKMYMLYNIV